MENSIIDNDEYTYKVCINNNNNLVHITDVAEINKWKEKKGNEKEYKWIHTKKENISKHKRSKSFIPDLANINVRDFDSYISYITKINILKDVNDNVGIENDLNTFEKILQNPYKYISVEELTSLKERKEEEINFDKLNKYSKVDYNVFFDEGNVECNISNLISLQEQLSNDLDRIESFMSAQISDKIKDYFNITIILKDVKNEIENLHSEVQNVKENLEKLKEAVKEMKELYGSNELRRKYQKIFSILQAFLHFQNLVQHLKWNIQNNKNLYASLYFVNQIVKFYSTNKKKIRYNFFINYASNFNWGYLKKVISRKFIFPFSYYSVRFIFYKSKEVGSKWNKKKKEKKKKEQKNRKEQIEEENEKEKEENEKNNYISHSIISKQNNFCICLTSEALKNGKGKTSNQQCDITKDMFTFVRTHKRVNNIFLYMYYYYSHYYYYYYYNCGCIYNKKIKFVKYIPYWNGFQLNKKGNKRKKKKNYFFTEYIKCKKKKKKVQKKNELHMLNELLFPLLLFDELFNHLNYFCLNKNYINQFTNELFYTTLNEYIILLQNDTTCDINNLPRMQIEFEDHEINNIEKDNIIKTKMKTGTDDKTTENKTRQELKNRTVNISGLSWSFKEENKEYGNINVRKLELSKQTNETQTKEKEIKKETETKTKTRTTVERTTVERTKVEKTKVERTKKDNEERPLRSYSDELIEKCKKKSMLNYTSRSIMKNIFKYVSFFPLSYFIKFLKSFFIKIKATYYRMKRWISFLIFKTLFISFDKEFMKNIKAYLHPSFFQAALFKKKNIIQKTKFLFYKFFYIFINIFLNLLNTFLHYVAILFEERKKTTIHLSINQVICFIWNSIDIIFFLVEKKKNLSNCYLQLFFYTYYKYFYIRNIMMKAKKKEQRHEKDQKNEKNEINQSSETNEKIKKYKIYKKEKKMEIKENNANVDEKENRMYLKFLKRKRGTEGYIEKQLFVKIKFQREQLKITRSIFYFYRSCIKVRIKYENQFLQSKNMIHKSNENENENMKYKNFEKTNGCNKNYKVSEKKNESIDEHINRLTEKSLFIKWRIKCLPQNTEKLKEHLTREIKLIYIPVGKVKKHILFTYFKQQALLSIQNFYEFKKVQIDKLFGVEKWDIVDIPNEINDQMKLHFGINNKHVNFISINKKSYYMTNSNLTFLSILVHYMNFLFALPFISDDIIDKIMSSFENYFQHIYRLIIKGDIVTNVSIKSITIKLLSLTINTVDFFLIIFNYMYAIFEKLQEIAIIEKNKRTQKRHKQKQRQGQGQNHNHAKNKNHKKQQCHRQNLKKNQEQNPKQKQSRSTYNTVELERSNTNQLKHDDKLCSDPSEASMELSERSFQKMKIKQDDNNTDKEKHKNKKFAHMDKKQTDNSDTSSETKYNKGETKREKENNGNDVKQNQQMNTEKIGCSADSNRKQKDLYYENNKKETNPDNKEKSSNDNVIKDYVNVKKKMNDQHKGKNIEESKQKQSRSQVHIDMRSIKKLILRCRKPFKRNCFYNEILPIHFELSLNEENIYNDKLKQVLNKMQILKKKLIEKIVDILATRFDDYANLWLSSENIKNNEMKNSKKYECDILPFGIQLISTYKVLSLYLFEEDTSNLFSYIFHDVANRFKLRINIFKEYKKYKQIAAKLTENEFSEKSEIDKLILNYFNCEFNEKIKANIKKNIGDKILIDITNVLVILYKIPSLCKILENFLKDFLQICKTYWSIQINPFTILKKYKN